MLHLIRSLFPLALSVAISTFLFGETVTEPKSDEDTPWNVETAPGPADLQQIDVTEGTWLNLDVSPDGKEVVFDLLGDIYVMPLISSETRIPRKLTSGMAWDMQPRYSPDGQWIAFTSDRSGKGNRGGDNIWVMDLDGEHLTQVTDEAYRLLNGAAWSPDGDYLVARKHFTSRRSLGAGEMWMYHRAAGSAKAMAGLQLTKRPTDQKDVNEPVFSPDGKYLYFSEDVSPGSTFQYDKDSNKQIYVIKRLDMESGDLSTYISGPGGACRPTPSPDGETIAFVRRVGAKTGLHLFDTKSGAVRLVYDQLERDMQEAWAIHGVYPTFAWTPDAQSIVIWAKGKIRRITVDSGDAEVLDFHIQDERKITQSLRFPIEVAPDEFDVKMLRNVVVSPDGSQVAFQALGYLYLRDLPDGEPRRLTQQQEHFEFMPSFSRDGRYLTYATWNDAQFGSIRVASSVAGESDNWKVTSAPGHYRNPVFSPSGDTIVFDKGTGGALLSPLWSHDTGMYAVSARGGAPKRIMKSQGTPRFGASDDRVYFVKSRSDKESDNRGLHSIKLDGSESREHFSSDWATEYVVSPDGNWIAFVERYRVHIAPFIRTGRAIKVGPKSTSLPLIRVSEEAGDWIHFSGDSQKLYWALGPILYSVDLADVRGHLFENDAEEVAPPEVTETAIGFRRQHASPSGTVALVGGRIVTMKDQEVIEDGTIVFQRNRITAVGPRDEIEIPPDANVISIAGQTVLPGFVDTHAHGPQAANGITPQRSWVDYARLAFGVTTIHDPSNHTHSIFAASEMTKAGVITAPRTFSTGTILYGATGSYRAEIQSLEDAQFHLRRMKAVGAFSVKSYNQPRRDQRQQVVAAARDLEMMVVPEGGSTFMHNMTMIVDGHTGIEHTLPVQTAYDDVYDLWRGTGVGYTPTLCVAYGGISGEQYWYQVDDLWLHPRLQHFVPPHILLPRSRRRNKAPDEDYNHIRVAEIAKHRVEQGGMVQAGGHGQLNGICTHWEMWSFVQGGMSPHDALRCGTLLGAKYLGLDGDLGSLEPGKLADVIVLEAGSDPMGDIRDSQNIHYVVANGRVFDARRMNELGSPAPRRPFYWEQEGYGGVSLTMPRTWGCGCQR